MQESANRTAGSASVLSASSPQPAALLAVQAANVALRRATAANNAATQAAPAAPHPPPYPPRDAVQGAPKSQPAHPKAKAARQPGALPSNTDPVAPFECRLLAGLTTARLDVAWQESPTYVRLLTQVLASLDGEKRDDFVLGLKQLMGWPNNTPGISSASPVSLSKRAAEMVRHGQAVFAKNTTWSPLQKLQYLDVVAHLDDTQYGRVRLLLETDLFWPCSFKSTLSDVRVLYGEREIAGAYLDTRKRMHRWEIKQATPEEIVQMKAYFATLQGPERYQFMLGWAYQDPPPPADKVVPTPGVVTRSSPLCAAHSVAPDVKPKPKELQA